MVLWEVYSRKIRALTVKVRDLYNFPDEKGMVIAMFFYGTTDIGRKRAVNQDNFKIKEYSEGVTLAVVCDGMGGARGGGVASSLAICAFMEYLDDNASTFTEDYDAPNADEAITDILKNAVVRANEAVFTAAASSPELTGMGTTLVCTLVTPQKLYCVNVGDSRMYHGTHSSIEQVTRDHSYVQYLVDIGRITPKKAKKSSHRNIITRAVGTESSVEADLYTLTKSTSESPVFVLLCSDGLTNMVELREIASALKSSDRSGDSLKRAAERVVTLANDHGGTDNITVVLLAY